MIRRVSPYVLAVFILASTPSLLTAQVERGTIAGLVHDASGAVVPGVDTSILFLILTPPLIKRQFVEISSP